MTTDILASFRSYFQRLQRACFEVSEEDTDPELGTSELMHNFHIRGS